MICYDLAHHQTCYYTGSASVVWVGGYPAAPSGPSHHSDCYLIDPDLSDCGGAGRAGPAPSSDHHQTCYLSVSAPVVWVGGYPAALPGPSHHSDCYLIDPDLSDCGDAGRAGPAPSSDHHQTGYDSGSAPVVWVGGYPAALPGPSHHSVCYLIDSASPDVRMSGRNLLI